MKTAVIALIRDLDRGKEHLEALPCLFDCEESVKTYAKYRLNSNVTVVAAVQTIEVEDAVKLVSWL